jgi:hypothetical protein
MSSAGAALPQPATDGQHQGLAQVRNIQSQPQVRVRFGDADLSAIARVVHKGREPQLAATVKALFDVKYGWSDGLIVELTSA